MESRIDKFLWSVRLYKTRSIAADACKKGVVTINEMAAKASRVVKVGDKIDIRRPPITYSFRILAIPTGRLGAKLVENYIKNITTDDNIALLEVIRLDRKNQRAKGMGRPTKKERRDISSFLDSEPYFIDNDD